MKLTIQIAKDNEQLGAKTFVSVFDARQAMNDFFDILEQELADNQKADETEAEEVE